MALCHRDFRVATVEARGFVPVDPWIAHKGGPIAPRIGDVIRYDKSNAEAEFFPDFDPRAKLKTHPGRKSMGPLQISTSNVRKIRITAGNQNSPGSNATPPASSSSAPADLSAAPAASAAAAPLTASFHLLFDKDRSVVFDCERVEVEMCSNNREQLRAAVMQISNEHRGRFHFLERVLHSFAVVINVLYGYGVSIYSGDRNSMVATAHLAANGDSLGIPVVAEGQVDVSNRSAALALTRLEGPVVIGFQVQRFVLGFFNAEPSLKTELGVHTNQSKEPNAESEPTDEEVTESKFRSPSSRKVEDVGSNAASSSSPQFRNENVGISFVELDDERPAKLTFVEDASQAAAPSNIEL